MSESLHPERHLEADSLSAFLEGALSEHERLECLAHLAECAQCREIVFLAQEPAPLVAAPSRVPWWQRWFAPFPVLTGAAVAGAIAVGAWFYIHRAPAPVPYVAKQVDNVPPLAPPPVVTPQPNATLESPKSRTVEEQSAPLRALRVGPPSQLRTPMSAPMMAPASPPPPPKVEVMRGQDVERAIPPPPPPVENSEPLRMNIQRNGSSTGDLSEVSGSVRDQSGGAIPGASVSLRQVAGASSGTTKTDERGRFDLAAIQPGRYELQITAPGFRSLSGEIELHAQDRAVMSSVLTVGAVTETVTVDAASPVMQTANADVSAAFGAATGVADLPNFGRNITALKALTLTPGASTVARGKLMVTLTTAGTLSFTKDEGKHWKAVKPAWQGKVVQLGMRPASPSNPESFQVTTDSGSVWLSRDGEHWFADTPQR